MKIISIIRGVQGVGGVPEVFVLGVAPENSPEVKEIKFYETGGFSGKAYRGRCYIVTFVDSTVKRLIPSECVIDIAIETAKDEEVVVPPLPEQD